MGKSAIERVPDNAIVVLEDVDALFAKGREKKIQQSPLTFSGLLNALDGVGNHHGLGFVLTTNFKDQLDAALIRDGRVDLHVRFDYCTPEQMEKLFDNFYPPQITCGPGAAASTEATADGERDPEIEALEAKLAALKKAKAAAANGAGGAGGAMAPEPNGAAFRDALLLALGDRKVTAAQLQSFFVTHRKCSAAEAIADVGAVAAAIDKRKEEKTEESAKPTESSEGGDSAKQSHGSKGKVPQKVHTEAAAEAKAVHVHIHACDN